MCPVPDVDGALTAAFLDAARLHKIPMNQDAGLYKAIVGAGQEAKSDEWFDDGAVWQWGYRPDRGRWYLWRWTPETGPRQVYDEAATR